MHPIDRSDLRILFNNAMSVLLESKMMSDVVSIQYESDCYMIEFKNKSKIKFSESELTLSYADRAKIDKRPSPYNVANAIYFSKNPLDLFTWREEIVERLAKYEHIKLKVCDSVFATCQGVELVINFEIQHGDPVYSIINPDGTHKFAIDANAAVCKAIEAFYLEIQGRISELNEIQSSLKIDSPLTP